MQGTIIDQGVELMLYGMGTVVVFLTLLVFTTGLMSRFLARFFPEPPAPTVTPAHAAPTRAQGVEGDHLVAVISGAIHQHRARRK